MKKLIALTLALIMSLSCFSLVSFAEETQAAEHLTEVPEGYVGIYTKDDLDNIKLNKSGKYILMNNIIFDDSDYVKGGSFYNSGKGWEPIGTSSASFSGVFDGNNYYIKNLYVNDSDAAAGDIGLFGHVSAGTIKNLRLKDVNITGYDTYDGTGGIAGSIYNSNVSYCSVSGEISGSASTGGICGESNGYSKIQYCSSSAQVTSPYNAGGITGVQSPSSNARTSSNYIRYCYNSGTVISEKGCAGGISADSMSRYYWSSSSLSGTSYSYNYSNIIDSYNCGTIIGYSKAGGIAGDFTGDDTCSSYMENCINVGNVSAEKNYGAIVGYAEYVTVKNCYYLDESVTAPTYSYGTSKSEDQLKKQSTFAGFNFETIWTMEGREDYPYPELLDTTLIFPGEDPDHKHEYTSETVTAPTCTEDGYTTYTCECGDSYVDDYTEKLGHKYTSEITIPATHLEEGVETFTCTCGDSYTKAISKLTKHTYEKTVTAPTCTEDGYTTYTCECGDSYVDDYTDKLAHEYTSEITIPATHLKEGVETFTCTCGDSYTKAISKLTKHTYEKTVTAPTCNSKGYTTYTCECGDSYVSDYVGVKAHSYTSAITTPATHLTEGIRTYTCSSCGSSYTENTAKIKAHSYYSSVTVDPTCEEDGYTVYVCDCGESYNDDFVPATGHDYEKGQCANCGDSNKTDNCTCMCHKSGIIGFIWKIVRVFYKFFGKNQICACGVSHY